MFYYLTEVYCSFIQRIWMKNMYCQFIFLFILIFGIGLYYCYKQKPSEYELHKKMLKDQQYILSKIKNISRR